MHSPQGAHNPLRFSRALLPSSFACKERGKKTVLFPLAEEAAILCKGPPGEGNGECTARRARTIPFVSAGHSFRQALLVRKGAKKQFSFRLRKRLLSCARARLILPLWPLHLNFMYTCRKSHNEFTERNLSIGLCILAGSDAEWQYQFLRIVFFNPLWNRAVRYGKMENIKGNRENRLPFVGVLRLERRTLCSQSRCANQLRHTPKYRLIFTFVKSGAKV